MLLLNILTLNNVSNPQIAVVVLINEPGGDLYHAGDTAAPTFSKIVAGTLQMLNVPPDDNSETARIYSGGQYDAH